MWPEEVLQKLAPIPNADQLYVTALMDKAGGLGPVLITMMQELESPEASQQLVAIQTLTTLAKAGQKMKKVREPTLALAPP